MKKTIRIILADPDPDYLDILKIKFISALHDRASVEVITDRKYFEDYFSVKREAELLVVGEGFYSPQLFSHRLSAILLLTEEKHKTAEEPPLSVYKYAGADIIYKRAAEALETKEDRHGRERTTRVTCVYSPIGGCGKTHTARGIAEHLSAAGYRVLYVDAEHLQTGFALFKDHVPIPFQTALAASRADDPYRLLAPYLKRETAHPVKRETAEADPSLKRAAAEIPSFRFLPSFGMSLSSAEIPYSFFERFILDAAAQDCFDHIIADTDTVFDDDKASLLGAADMVVLILPDSPEGAYAKELLQNSMVFQDDEKYCLQEPDKGGYVSEEQVSLICRLISSGEGEQQKK